MNLPAKALRTWTIALGTDASTPFNFPGYSAHVEMALMSRAGLSNADVLRIATMAPGSWELKQGRDDRILKGRLIDPGVDGGEVMREGKGRL